MQIAELALPRAMETALTTMLRQLAAERVVERLWANDASLWHPSAETQRGIRQRLGWLALPDLAPADSALRPWLDAPAPPRSVLCVAAGAAQSSIRLWRDLASADRQRRLILLDSVEPTLVQTTLAAVDWSRTALLLAATELTPELEALARLALYARSQQLVVGPLALISAPGSEVMQRLVVAGGAEAELIAVPADLGERFGALSAFGLLPAALLGQPVAALINQALDAREACQRPDLHENPGALLGALLGVLAQHGRDKLTLLAGPALAPLARWIASFVAASLGKHGRGFVPLTDEPLVTPVSYRADRCFVALRLADAPNATLDARIAALRAAGQPVVVLTLTDRAAIMAHQLGWQVAVAVAASVIGVNPFDEPDTAAMSVFIQRRLADAAPLPIEPTTGSAAVTLAEGVRAAVPLLGRARWAALALYLPPAAEQSNEIAALRRLLLGRAGLPTVVVAPLRDHWFSVQLLHAGRRDNVVLALITPPRRAAPIPGLSWGLDRLSHTRMAVELAAWRRMDRALVVLDLDDPLDGLRECYATLDRLL